MRAPSGIHDEVHADLLRVRIVGYFRTDLHPVQAVAIQQMLDGRLCRSHVRLRERLPKAQAGDVDQLAGVGRIGEMAQHRYVSHEPAILGDDSHHHAIGRGWGKVAIHLDVVVSASGIQPLDGRMHIRQPQGRSLLQRDNVSQFRGGQRLLRRIVLNTGDGLPFVLRRLRPDRLRTGQQRHR